MDATVTDAAAARMSKTAVACSATPGQCNLATTPTVAKLQAGYALPTLASGQFYEITVAANVTATTGSVSNTTTLHTTTCRDCSSDVSSTDPDTVNERADLQISKDDGVTSVNAGGSTTYT